MTFTSHPFSGIADLQMILGLVKARPVERILDYPSLIDLQELLARPEIQAATRIWQTPAGGCAGYAMINHGQTFAHLAFEAAQGLAASEIGAEMLDWGEGAYRDRFHGETSELFASTHDTQAERIALLEAHGFLRETESVVHMECSLEEPIAAAQAAPGFTIRAVNGEREDAAWVSLNRAAHGTQNMTLEGRRSMTHTPEYDPELDLVAVAPDGSLAAYVFGSFNPEEIALSGRKIGFTDPVATHPAYQRRGLAQALLLECLRRLKQRGLQTARLGTSSANLAMQKAAQSVGFREVDRAWHYAKSIKLTSQ